MSGIYFHAVGREPVVVRGAERARIEVLVRDTFREVLRRPHMARLRRVLRLNGAPAVEGFDYDQARLTELEWGLGEQLWAAGPSGAERVGLVGLAANTTVAEVAASQALVWLHYGCEAHGWVDGADRGWLAERYQDALDAGVARAGLGWEKVIELLRQDSTGAVVTSFYGDFPNVEEVINAGVWPEAGPRGASVSDADLAAREALWEGLTDERRWDLGMAALRARPAGDGELRWSPDVFARMGIEHDHHAEELVRGGFQLRLSPGETPA